MNRKCLVAGIILLFVGTSVIPTTAQDTEKSSLPTSSGKWLYVGGSGPGNYTTIQSAIDAASPGDIIFVFNGMHYENNVVYKSLKIIGEKRDTTYILGDGITPCLNITANEVTISGFTIGNHNGTAITLESSASTITNNMIYNASIGIWASEKTSDNLIYRNNICINQNPANTTHNAIDYGTNQWDDGYLYGGNYWNDYTGKDNFHGPNQNISGSDGKGDTPYLIDGGKNQDHYPFMNYNGWLKTSPPHSNFTYQYSLPRGQIEFFDTSTDTDGHVTTWYWEFGDGDTSTVQNPIHQYAPDDHTYMVNLTVKDNDGYTDMRTKNIIIGPIAEADGPYIGYVDELLVFDGSRSYDPYGTIISYQWDFGDGNTGSGAHPAHSYSTFGMYTVSLTVIDNNGSTGLDATYVKISSGVVHYVGGSGPHNYSVIQYAIDNASDGDTVFVYSGIYSDFFPEYWACVYIDKSINLVGEDKNTTIINGTNSQRVIQVQYNTTGVSISGFTIQHGNNPKPSDWEPGIDIASHIRIHNNIIKNCQHGIFVQEQFTDILVYNNTIIDNWYGIYTQFTSNSFLKIFHNTIADNNYGVYSYASNELSIFENRIINNSEGIHLDYGESNNNIYSNQIRDNRVGIKIGTSISTTIEKNNFIKNDKQAFLSKITLLSSMSSLPTYRQNWVENYWDDWTKKTPRNIGGVITFYIIIIIPWIPPLIDEVPIGIFPYLEFDVHPAQEPYNLPW
jgi:parallel beta-helix repeat protein